MQAIAGTISAQLGKAPDYYDTGFIANFAGIDTVRPFLGNLSAPQTAVGAFAGDVCRLFDNGTGAACATAPNTLISLNADTGCIAAGGPCPAVTITKNQVRFIMNSLVAQSVFGTPFGDTPRNPVRDAITNVANFSVFKHFKLSERASFEFHTAFLNVFNHANFSSVDPFIEDAGAGGFSTGFGNPKLTDNVPGVVNFPVEASRRIIFGGKIIY